MRPTIRKIAEDNGVSPATVSLVLNNKPGVRPETRQRITKVLEENGYEIRKYENRESIQYICYKKSEWFSERPDSFYSYVMSGIAEGCRKMDATLHVSYASEETMQEQMDEAVKMGASGIVLLGTELAPDETLPFSAYEIPVVIMDHPFYAQPLNCIFPDDSSGLNEAVEHLTGLGHTQIGFISLRGTFGELDNRERSWRRIMDEHGLCISEEHVLHLSTCVADAQCEIEQYLEKTASVPTAMIAVNDVLGSALIGVLLRRSIRVPEDMSVIGFDNSGLCELTVPNLSSIDTQIGKMGELAVRRLFELAKWKDEQPVKTMTATRLILRSSTGIAPR